MTRRDWIVAIGAPVAFAAYYGVTVWPGIGPRQCQAYATTAFYLTVRDADTGAPIGRGTVLSGSIDGVEFVDERTLEDDRHAFDIGAEAGNYTLRVRKPGYQPWQRANLVAPDLDGCGHTSSVPLTAWLEPTIQQ